MGKNKELLKQDKGWNAAILSLALPFLFHFLLVQIVELLGRYVWYQLALMEGNSLGYVAVFMNLFIFRKYILGEDYPLNGKIVLAVTFALAIILFAIDWL